MDRRGADRGKRIRRYQRGLFLLPILQFRLGLAAAANAGRSALIERHDSIPPLLSTSVQSGIPVDCGFLPRSIEKEARGETAFFRCGAVGHITHQLGASGVKFLG